MAAPITPTTPNVDGKPITVFLTFTSTGGPLRDETSLATYNPLIDLRIGHPVLGGLLITTAGDAPSTSQILKPSKEMARGTDGDTNGEWDIEDANTVGLYHTSNVSGLLMLTYIAFGSQQA